MQTALSVISTVRDFFVSEWMPKENQKKEKAPLESLSVEKVMVFHSVRACPDVFYINWEDFDFEEKEQKDRARESPLKTRYSGHQYSRLMRDTTK